MEKKTVLIVEGHSLVRAGLRALLSEEAGLHIGGETDNVTGAIGLMAAEHPDLLLMELTLQEPHGFEAIAEAKRRFPQLKVLVLTSHRTEDCIHRSLAAGADGYILKDASPQELLAAIRSVLRGKTYLSPAIANTVIRGYLGARKGTNRPEARESITHRQRQVLKLVAEGHANKSIADTLCLSVKTVEKHRSNVMKKFDLHNASMLTTFAIAKGFVDAGTRETNCQI